MTDTFKHKSWVGSLYTVIEAGNKNLLKQNLQKMMFDLLRDYAEYNMSTVMKDLHDMYLLYIFSADSTPNSDTILVLAIIKKMDITFNNIEDYVGDSNTYHFESINDNINGSFSNFNLIGYQYRDNWFLVHKDYVNQLIFKE